MLLHVTQTILSYKTLFFSGCGAFSWRYFCPILSFFFLPANRLKQITTQNLPLQRRHSFTSDLKNTQNMNKNKTKQNRIFFVTKTFL